VSAKQSHTATVMRRIGFGLSFIFHDRGSVPTKRRWKLQRAFPDVDSDAQ